MSQSAALSKVTETDLARPFAFVTNNDLADALEVTGTSSYYTDPFHTAGTNLQTSEVTYTGVIGTVWFYWDSGSTPEGAMYSSAGGVAGSYEVTLRVFTQGGTGLAGLVEVLPYIDNRDPGSPGTNADLNFLTAPSTRYYFQVGVKAHIPDAFFHIDSITAPAAPSNDNYTAYTEYDVNWTSPVNISGDNLATATLEGAETGDRNPYGDGRSIWFKFTASDPTNPVLHITTDNVGDASGVPTDSRVLTVGLYSSYVSSALGDAVLLYSNDLVPSSAGDKHGGRAKFRFDPDFAPFSNNLRARIGAFYPQVTNTRVNVWVTPGLVNDKPEGALNLLTALTLTGDTTSATLTRGEFLVLKAADAATAYQGSLWYAWTAITTDDVTFTYAHVAGTSDARLKIHTGTPGPLVDPDNDLPDDLIGLTEILDSGDGSPSTTITLTAPTVDETYYIQALSAADGDHTITWDFAGSDPGSITPPGTDTGSLSGNADVQLIFSSAAQLTAIGSVTTLHPLRVRPLMTTRIDMPEPAILMGKPVLPLYWAKPASSMSVTQGAGHIEVIPDPDPPALPGGSGVTANWPAGGKPNYWWTVNDLADPGSGSGTLISNWPEHFGGPSLYSSGIYRPTLKHRDHFGANGRKVTYTKSLIFNPDEVDHMWVTFGTSIPQPYTVMMAGIILSYPTRTYGHYLMDAGKPTATKNVNYDWTINDGLAYRSLMLFQLHSALVCTSHRVEDGVYARVTHNYRPDPRVFLGIFNGSSSYVGYMDTRDKKVARGRTANHPVTKLVFGRRQDHVSDNLATHMVLFEIRIWRKALTAAEYRAQYKQMAALWKFNVYDRDGL